VFSEATFKRIVSPTLACAEFAEASKTLKNKNPHYLKNNNFE